MEFKRILAGKPFVLLIVALLLINTYLFVYQNNLEEVGFLYYGEVYDQVLDELAGLSYEEGFEKCKEYEHFVMEQILEGTWESSQESAIKSEIIKQIKGQYAHILGYQDYLSDIQQNAKQLQMISLFSNPNSFAYKNAVKTAKDFAALLSVNVTMGRDLAITEVFSDQWTDVIVILPVFLVCGLFLLERKKGLDTLVHATPAGRVKLAIKRIVILLLASAISVFVLYGSRILLNGLMYCGLGEWKRSLQSIPMFYNVPYPVTVGEFWTWYLIMKTAGLFLAGLVLWLIQLLFSNIPVALGISGIVVGVEFACTAIPSSSIFAVFRYVNVLSYINYLPVFTRYLNLSVFGAIISGDALVRLLLPILCIVFAFVILFLSEKKHPVAAQNTLIRKAHLLQAKLDRALSGGGLLVKEAKKLLIYRRGIFVLILLAVLLTQMGTPIREESPLDMYLQYYEEKYNGPITEETVLSLREELSQAKETERIAALKQLILKATNAGDGAWIVPSAPYEALFNPQRYHYTIALVALLFVVLLVSPIASQERQSAMLDLLCSTPAGGHKLWRTKQILVLSCTFMVWFMVYGSELIKLIEAYGKLSCLRAPASSIPDLAFAKWKITLGEALALLYGLRLLVLLTVSEICFCLSAMCRKNSNAIILGCCAIVMPASLAAINSFIGKSLSLLMPLTVVDILPGLYPYLFTVVLYLVAFVFSKIRFHKFR